MATALTVTPLKQESTLEKSERLGAEITELCSYIYAAARTAYDNRQLSCYYDHDGSLVIKGRFPAEQGALIVKALEMAMEKDFADKASVGAASPLKGDNKPRQTFPRKHLGGSPVLRRWRWSRRL